MVTKYHMEESKQKQTNPQQNPWQNMNMLTPNQSFENQ